MEDQLKWRVVRTQDAEKQVNEKVSNPSVPISDVCDVLKEYRAASEEIALYDLPYARAHDVETRLWAAHSRINAVFRKQLSKLRKQSPARPVESRKFTKLYLEFLKNSQRFYRDYIRKLNAQFGAIPELEQIAQQHAGEQVKPQKESPPKLRHQTMLSCHQTLIYLGDLFRYQATERLDKTPAWGPARGYYDLASTLRPTSGMAYHQQSVIAFEEGDHLRATYYLYRAIVVEEPHPNAIFNLELEFKKARKAWDNGELIPKASPGDRNGTRKAMNAWFIRLHSLCVMGEAFSGHDELEREVLNHLAHECQSQSPDGIVAKMCFVNFAAQHTAAGRFQKSPDHAEYMQSYFFYLRLNVKMFETLLRTYSRDLEKAMSGNAPSGNPKTDKTLTAQVTNVSRLLLPCLRLSSTWLLVNAQILAAGVGDEHLTTAISSFWTIYTKTLSLIASAFPVQQLPELSYQLEEDVDSIGFLPLECERSQKLWISEATGSKKPKYSESGQQRLPPDMEMLARIREVLIDGLLLAVDNDIPVIFDGSVFLYGFPEQTGHPHEVAIASPAVLELPEKAPYTTIEQERERRNHIQQASMHSEYVSRVSTKQAEDQDDDLSRMVDDLVGPELLNEDDQGLHRLQEQDRYYGNSRTSSDHASLAPGNQMQRLHSLSSIWDALPPDERTPSRAKNRALQTPPQASVRRSSAHSRIGSATSIHSRDSWHDPQSISSFAPTPPHSHAGPRGLVDRRNNSFVSVHGLDSGLHSPLLFGAGGGPWSSTPRTNANSQTPPNGQGG